MTCFRDDYIYIYMPNPAGGIWPKKKKAFQSPTFLELDPIKTFSFPSVWLQDFTGSNCHVHSFSVACKLPLGRTIMIQHYLCCTEEQRAS